MMTYGTHSLNTCSAGDLTNGFQVYSKAISGIQNGAPDGIALSLNSGSTIVELLSYEGTFSASGGPAAGVLSTDVGVSETGSTPVGSSLQRVGNGTKGSDFSWSGPSAGSAGSINSGQSVPEPSSVLFLGVASLMALVLSLLCRRTGD